MKHRKRRAGYPLRAGIAVTAAALAAVLAPVVWPSDSADAQPIAVASALPEPALDAQGHLVAPGRTEIVAFDLRTGETFTTANPHEEMPGLSIVKLFIAQYIVDHGDPADVPVAQQMIRVSDDGLASQLYRKYPTSISTVAREYGLNDTVAERRWGFSSVSAWDEAQFLKQLVNSAPSGSVATAMYQSAPIAADGYAQDYGTSRLPGVQGTKFGWASDRFSSHATVTIGDGYVIAANTYGTAAQLTEDVLAAFPGAPAAPRVPGFPAAPGLPALPVPGQGELPGFEVLPELPLPVPAAPQVPGLPTLPF